MGRAFDAIASFHDEETSLAIKCIYSVHLIRWYLNFD